MSKAPLLVASTLPDDEQIALNAAIAVWEEKADEKAKAEDAEIGARLAIITRWGKGAEEGTNTITLKDGRKLKIDVRVNRKVEEDQFEAARTFAINDTTERGQTLIQLLNDVFAMKPSLVVREWKALGGNARKMLADLVTEKPGTPGLKIEDAK